MRKNLQDSARRFLREPAPTLAMRPKPPKTARDAFFCPNPYLAHTCVTKRAVGRFLRLLQDGILIYDRLSYFQKNYI